MNEKTRKKIRDILLEKPDCTRNTSGDYVNEYGFPVFNILATYSMPAVQKQLQALKKIKVTK